MRTSLLSFSIVLLALAGCGESSDGTGNKPSIPEVPADGVEAECGSVRMTQYTSSDRRWCGFDRTSAILPDFVRAGMTVAIAEPYNGSSYGGAAGEACGECWEISTTFATQLVMVHDLCPIEGNPVCAGGHFHFDVAGEVADAIDGGEWMGEAAVRRVPCPVDGNIYVYITARNQWGYLQIAFFNHRFPIRTVEYRAANDTAWHPMERCLARWCLSEDKETFSEGGPGGVFRLTSAAGEVIEGEAVLTYAVPEESDFNTGMQFAEAAAPSGECAFTPPAEVYTDTWGGIDGVRWEPNSWGATTLAETTDGCAEASGSCLRLDHFADSGLHLTYRHTFPKATFSAIELQLRADAPGTVEIAPRSQDARCSNPQVVNVTTQWTGATIRIADSCPDTDWLHGLTISRSTGLSTLFTDNIVFQP